MAYSLNELALITGLTTRTLRNYLRMDLLNGEKIDGNWSFSEEDVAAFTASPAVRQTISAKGNGLVLDFLTDPFKKGNRICTILDFPVSDGEAAEISGFFCERITKNGSDISFKYIREKGFARFILSGSEDQVTDLMRAYYERE